MKSVIRLLIGAVMVVLVVIGGFGAVPAIAADLTNGARVFTANCNACHMGGNNYVNAMKTLKKDDLEKYGMASLDAIKTQIKQGKLAMPSFLGRLSEAEIEDVAAYVLDQAEKGW